METITQRRTSAAETGFAKPARAASSVFDAGRQAAPPPAPKYKRLPVLDVAAVVVRKGVPIPESTGRRTGPSPYRELLGKMKRGDSVELSPGYAKSMVSAAKKAGVKLAVRRLGDDLVGVWRVE